MGKLDLTNVYDLENPPIKECPFCGSDTFYVKQSYSGISYCYHHFDGSEADNSEMYSGSSYKEIGKFAICADCGKRMFRYRR